MPNAKDSRGNLETVTVEHENHFDTFTSFAATTASNFVILASTAGQSIHITDILVHAESATTFSLLENTVAPATKLVLGLGQAESIPYSFREPIILTSGQNLLATSTVTGTSLLITGYRK